MRISSLIAAGGVGAALLVGSSGVAHAAAPPPFGFWTSDSGEQLLVGHDWLCSEGVNGAITTSGPCKWQAGDAGGILTIMSSQLRRPAPVYFNIVWVDDSTITVFGDTFYLQQ